MNDYTTVIPTDLITPLGAYVRLRGQGEAAFLLESVERGRLGRLLLRRLRRAHRVDLEEAQSATRRWSATSRYDHVAMLEPTVPLPADGPDLPESRFVVADTLMRFDHAAALAEVLCGDAEELRALLDAPAARAAARQRDARPRPSATPAAFEYERSVERAKEHIRAGDAFQIVVSQRAERPTSASALDLYRALRRVNPSPYLFLLELGDLALIGSSPETLVKVEGRRASLNPIAGTTAPGPGDAERLLASEKDRAEHVMLVDLGRNDLSRVCEPGRVQVERFMEPERFSHVDPPRLGGGRRAA